MLRMAEIHMAQCDILEQSFLELDQECPWLASVWRKLRL